MRSLPHLVNFPKVLIDEHAKHTQTRIRTIDEKTMKTVSILEYDHEGHQFFPSFVVRDDLKGGDREFDFDEVVINPSQKWMDDYLEWNRFSRLPDDPIDDDEHLEKDATAMPTFATLEELHEFNAKGSQLAERLALELGGIDCIQVERFKPLYSDMQVGSIASWWHLKDRNYGFVVSVQRLPVSDCLKSKLQTFRYQKSMGLWKQPNTTRALKQEGQELEERLLWELNAESTKATHATNHGGDASAETLPKENSNIGLICSMESPRSVKQPIATPPVKAAVE